MADLTCIDLGVISYEGALRLQEELLRHVASAHEERAYLLLAEHYPPVITLGRKGKSQHILASPEELAKLGIEVYRTSRGGGVTYHGPGQVVGYPVFRPSDRGLGVREYVAGLEEVLIRVLGRFGVAARRIEGQPGAWVGREKVGAVGVAFWRWIAYHGLALNVCAELSHFDLIVPCGIRDCRVTSLRMLGCESASVDRVKGMLAEEMKEVFGFARAVEDNTMQCLPRCLCEEARV